MSCPTVAFPSVTTTNVTSGAPFDQPLFVAAIPGTSDLAVVERLGRIRIIRAGAVLPTDFLTLTPTSIIDGTNINEPSTSEQGLLGLAFHPSYATNGRFFIAYTQGSDNGGRRNVVAEWARNPANHDVALTSEVHRLVNVVDPEWNHNGGMLVFGPDGFLYVGMGDGGGGEDSGHGPIGNGLNKNTLLGKLLRLDVDAAGDEYAAAGNPFSPPEGLPQIYAYGLRNPWRFSIDATGSTIYIGDVGQYDIEEIDAISIADARGANFGWAAFEGTVMTDYVNDAGPLVANHTPPVLDVPHDNSVIGNLSAIIGGNVYRGSAIPSLTGWYLFGSTSGNVGAFRYCGGIATNVQRVNSLSGRAGAIGSFGEDLNHELYIVDLAGSVLRIVPN